MHQTEIEYAINLAKLAGEQRTENAKPTRDATQLGPLATDVIKLLRGESSAGSAAKAWHGVIQQLAQPTSATPCPAA